MGRVTRSDYHIISTVSRLGVLACGQLTFIAIVTRRAHVHSTECYTGLNVNHVVGSGTPALRLQREYH